MAKAKEIAGAFAGKSVAGKWADKIGTVKERAPKADTKATWQNKFDTAKDFLDKVNDSAFEVTTGGGEKINVACIERATAREMLGKKPDGSLPATQQLVKRELAMTGTIADRAVRTDKDEDIICILVDKLEDAPGSNLQERVIYAKGATQGKEKFGSLITSLGKHWTIGVTEAEVKKWLAGRKAK